MTLPETKEEVWFCKINDWKFNDFFFGLHP